MPFAAFDALVERLLLPVIRPGASRKRLASRIQRAAFALAMLMAASLVTTSLGLQFRSLYDSTRAAHESTLLVLEHDLRNQLDGVAEEIMFLSKSPLVWTALSDSAGRDSYLSPYLRNQRELNPLTSIALLDYRGRYIAGAREVLAPENDANGAKTQDTSQFLAQIVATGRPAGRLLAGPRQLMGFPVIYPVTRDVIGILLVEVNLTGLVHSRANTLGSRLGIALHQGKRELLAFPDARETRHLSSRAPLTSQKVQGVFDFELELFTRQSPWIGPVLTLLAVYLAVSAVMVWLTWRVSERLAGRLTLRLDRLADSVSRGEEPVINPDEPENDEISTLARVLKESLRARREFAEHLEEQVEQRTRQLAKSEAQYRFLAENIKDVVWTLDVDTLRFVYVSPSVERLRGLTPEEVLAEPMDAALAPEAGIALKSLIRERAAAYLSGAEPHDRFYINEVEQPCKGGGLVWTEVITSYRLDEKSGHVHVLGVTRDISERRHAEEMERYGAFQSGVAEMGVSVLHNVGNTITAVLSDADALRDATADFARIGELLERSAKEESLRLGRGEPTRAEVERQVDIEGEAAGMIRRLANEGLKPRCLRIANSVQHIAEIVRIQQNAALPETLSSTFDLERTVRDALSMQEDILERHGIRASIALDPTLGPLTLSRNRFLQALLNVIRNAMEAIQARQAMAQETLDPSNGQTAQAAAEPGAPRSSQQLFPGRIRIESEALEGNRFRLRISDNGIGIDPTQHDKLFRFGYSTKTRGSGFGLHATALFVQEMGGHIALDSDGPGQGARLVIELPRSLPSLAPATPAPVSP